MDVSINGQCQIEFDECSLDKPGQLGIRGTLMHHHGTLV